ncbi:hypothetical protein Q2T40_12095 [Winogradskyella maritima]|uniref:Uncharacterized protein n=1 Tax=Winogradskyella maritima TaxID=1517766 RepID=A0ABV8AL30_9FLAO|nr:hypothetical protein [Winogradskyella maritima]
MLKKIGITILILVLVTIGLIYWSVSGSPKSFGRAVLVDFDSVEDINFKDYDSVLISASNAFNADGLKRFMQGHQYRDAWAAKVKVPILYLDSLNGGMTIVKEGGGKQTHSLRLLGGDSITYTIRSVNKDPKPLIPEFAKTLGLENIIEDGISAQHPYAAILAAALSKPANVISTYPKMFFVPEQNALGKYNEEYGNRLFLLEFETKSKKNWTPLDSISEIIDTDNLQKMRKKIGQRIQVDKRALIRSRLFDIIIGDWDRHAKQWGWAIQKVDSLNFKAIPVAGDRDNAFFMVDGIIPTMLSNKNAVKELRPFTSEVDYMEGLVYPFDRYFLLNTPPEMFKSEAKFLQNNLNNEAIEEALQKWPKTIRELNGEDIARKLKSRRDSINVYALEFKKIIDRQGPLANHLKGSKKLELNHGLQSCFECDN